MKIIQRRLKCPSFFDMNFSEKVMSLLSDSLVKYPDIFLVDLKFQLIMQ